MDFGRPNAEIGRKMANGRLLFLALDIQHFTTYMITIGGNTIIATWKIWSAKIWQFGE